MGRGECLESLALPLIRKSLLRVMMRFSGLMTPVGNVTVKNFCIEIYKGLTHLDFQDEAIRKSKAPTKVCFVLLERPPKERFLSKPCLKGEISS